MPAVEEKVALRALMGDVRAVRAIVPDVSEQTLMRWAKLGLMPAGVRVSGKRLWNLDVIQAWVAGGCKPVRAIGGAA